jgi:hypothetical protein
MRNKVVTTKAIPGEAISIVLRKRARAAGLAAERITAHSLRAGHATSAAVAGVAWTGSPPGPDTSACQPSSSGTSAPPKPWSTPPAATSVCEIDGVWTQRQGSLNPLPIWPVAFTRKPDRRGSAL